MDKQGTAGTIYHISMIKNAACWRDMTSQLVEVMFKITIRDCKGSGTNGVLPIICSTVVRLVQHFPIAKGCPA